jgi:conjugative transfer signal peptidase TraF
MTAGTIADRWDRAGRWHLPMRRVWLMASPLAVLGVCGLAGLRLNLTGSLPIGLYRVSHAAPVREAIVLACLPPAVAAFARARGYVPNGGQCPGGVLPVGKPILAISGDTVTLTPTGLLVNGTPVPNSRALAADRQGRPLPGLTVGRYVVRPGTVWIVSSYSRFSFDSRYFGAVETGQIRANVRRLWSAGSAR